MKTCRNILVVLLAMILLISSSGYILYSTSCLCSGEKYTSFFIRPETCKTSFHKHHNHDLEGNVQRCSAGDCHECSSQEGAHQDACGCESPEIFFFKLEDNLIREEAKFLVSEAPVLSIFTSDLLKKLISDTEIFENTVEFYSPPRQISSSIEFLITIQQLKIPSLA